MQDCRLSNYWDMSSIPVPPPAGNTFDFSVGYEPILSLGLWKRPGKKVQNWAWLSTGLSSMKKEPKWKPGPIETLISHLI